MAKTKITIFDAEHAKAGVATSDFSKDGGFSPLDKGQNLWVKKGLLYAGPVPIANSGTVNKIVAWAIGYNNNTVIPLAVGMNDDEDGYFYEITYTTGAGTQKLTTNTKNYNQFQTDAIFYDGNFYVSSEIDVGRFTYAFGSASYTWWSALQSNLNLYTPHHFFIYDGAMHITDDYKIHSWDGSTAIDSAYQVDSAYKITTAIVHKNKIHAFANPDYGTGKSRFTPTKCFIFDKRISEDEYIDDFKINDKVYTAKSHEGTLLLWTSKAFGYWNGIKFKKLLDLDPDYPVYKQMVTSNSEVLMFAHKKDIIAFDGNKISYLFSTDSHPTLPMNSYDIDAIFCGYDDKIWVSIDDLTYRLSFIDSSGDGGGYHLFNRIDFSENYHIRRILVELGDELESGSDMPVTFLNENDDEVIVGDIKDSNGDEFYKDFSNVDEECSSLQLRIQNKTNAKPIKKITVWIEPAGDDIQP